MRKLLALLILAVVGFYVAWPAWSGYRIAAALQSKDEAVLESKIDFPSVRQNLRPIVSSEVEKRLTQQGAAAGLLTGDIKTQLMPRIVDGILQSLITPSNVIRIANDSAGAASAVEKIVSEQLTKAMGGLGGLAGVLGNQGAGGQTGGQGGLGGVLGNVIGGGSSIPGLPGGLGDLAKKMPGAQPQATPTQAPATQSTSAGSKASFGMGNIKGFGFDGPLGFNVSLAKDASAPKADVTAGLAFSGFDWKLVKLIPNL